MKDNRQFDKLDAGLQVLCSVGLHDFYYEQGHLYVDLPPELWKNTEFTDKLIYYGWCSDEGTSSFRFNVGWVSCG